MSEVKNIPEGWVETTLGEVLSFDNDRISVSELNIDNYISTENLLPDKQGITQSSILPNIPKVSKFEMGDVLFSNIRTYFKKVWFSDRIGGCSNDVIIFKPKDDTQIIKKFLYYFISSDLFIDFTVKSAKGTKMPRGDKNAMLLYNFNLPPLHEQQSIASILTSFDNKIELLQAQNKTLEEMAQTIFTEWFGKYRVDDELPEGWSVGKLSEIANLKSGFAFKAEDFIEESNFKAIKIKDLKGNGNISLNDISSISEDITKLDRVQYFKLNEGDILLAMSGNTTGKIGVLPSSENEIYLNQRVGKFFLKDKKYNSFLYNFLMSGSFEEKILAMGYGSAQPNINPSQIENIDITYPDDSKMNDYLKISNPIFEKVLKNNTQIQTLTKTRDALLPRLMSGEMRVKM